jgi:hypothetical protein
MDKERIGNADRGRDKALSTTLTTLMKLRDIALPLRSQMRYSKLTLR